MKNIENRFDTKSGFHTMHERSGETRRERHFAGVAQWLESLPSKQTVVGSSPIARSIVFLLGCVAQVVRARL